MKKALETPIAADDPPIAAEKSFGELWLADDVEAISARGPFDEHGGYRRQSADHRRQSAFPEMLARVTRGR